jgi:hypothetical protein
MDYAIRGLFRPFEEYADSCTLTVGILCSVFFLGCTLQSSSETSCLLYVERDISVMIWISVFNYLD